MKPLLFPPVASPYLVPWNRRFRVADAPTEPPDDAPGKKKLAERLASAVARMAAAQEKLYADDRYSLLLVFQAMDAAGKDGTIKAVTTGLNPTGCQVFSFKAPSAEELDHDFLWRIWRALPERGRIGIFNRSHYEEVIVVRVHPEFLGGQRLARGTDGRELWKERYDSIRDMERHLARSGTAILKFFLNVSRDEQKKRFLDRIEEQKANWKFSAKDVAERAHWDGYMQAYEDALGETSRPWAPWFAVPADSKGFMRTCVAEIVAETLESLPLRFPVVPREEKKRMAELRAKLESDEL
jgi:PPK2 family polyphosphate:nucleotide phosphotransferase